MGVRILADEHCERRTVQRLRADGHDVERVVSVDALGPGSDDAEILAYARRENRYVLTADDDFLSEFADVDHPGVLFLPNERLAPDTIADVVSTLAGHLSREDQADVVYVTREWL